MNKIIIILFALFFITACDTQDVPNGHKGFMFDRTGAFAFYLGGDGLQTDHLLSEGTHYTGFYDEVLGVNCQDAHVKEQLPVLTKSDMKVGVDLRITYSAKCDKDSMIQILNQVSRQSTEDPFVQPELIFEKYVMPITRESLRNNLAGVTIEEVKDIRGELAASVRADLEKVITERGFPVKIDVLTISNINLPEAITEKIKEIEVARMEANKEAEKQRASKVRLERELFEAQQERLVAAEQAEKAKQVQMIEADAAFEVRKKEADGIRELRSQLTPAYLNYLELERGAEVQKKMAEALGNGGTTWVLGNNGFLVPPGSNANVSVTK